MARPSSLASPASQLVADCLRAAKTPMTAYQLLNALREKGIKSAPIIYRALETLKESGEIHKINELGAFIACNYAHEGKHPFSVLTICHSCHHVDELQDHGVLHQLESLRQHGVHLSKNAVIELPITCDNCAA